MQANGSATAAGRMLVIPWTMRAACPTVTLHIEEDTVPRHQVGQILSAARLQVPQAPALSRHCGALHIHGSGRPPPPALKGLRTHVSQAQVALLSVVVAGGGVLVAALRKYCFDSPGATERFPFERHGQQRPTIRHGSTLFCSLLHTLLPTNSSVLFRAAAGDPEPGAGPGDGAVWVALGDGVGQSAADTLSPFRLKPYLDPLEAGSCSCSIKDPKTIAAARYGGGLLLKLVYFDGGLLIALQLAGLAGLCWLTSAVMAAAPICKTDGELPQKLWAAAMVLCVLGWLATATLVAAAGLWVRRPAGFANLGAHW